MTDLENTAGTTTQAYRPWLDASLPVEERVELVLGEMTLEEKAGLFFHTMIAMGKDGELSTGDPVFGIASNEEYVVGRSLSHFNLLGVPPTAGEIARWHNKLQELAAKSGEPVLMASALADGRVTRRVVRAETPAFLPPILRPVAEGLLHHPTAK